MIKKLLFVIDSLECAGAEKSLVTLLNLLDLSKYSVDIMLFGHGGVLEELVPEQVNILKPLKYTEFSKLNFPKAVIYSFKYLNFKFLFSRISYSTEIRKKRYDNTQKARVFWERVSPVIEENSNYYDVAISYAQGVPTFYVAEKVRANRKFAWVNVSYRLDEYEKKFQRRFYNQFNRIVTVSDSANAVFKETFPEYSDIAEVIYDINNPNFIWKMADVGKSYEDKFQGLRILTIGRLASGKGYDIALEACKLLKEKGIKFRWYALGKGPLQRDIETFIQENDLKNHFVLLGVKSNPYPYIKDADIYVQTSRYEGFGLAIAEARMLNKPVVTTCFDAVYNQIINYKNGLVMDMNAKSIYQGIVELVTNQDLRLNIINFLKKEKKGNVEEIEKFYKLIS